MSTPRLCPCGHVENMCLRLEAAKWCPPSETLAAAEARAQDTATVARERIDSLEQENFEIHERAERYREALQVVRHFGVFTTYDPKATDQENDELQRRYRRIRKALDEAFADAEEQSKGEHLAEQRASEEWQEEKHGRRDRA